MGTQEYINHFYDSTVNCGNCEHCLTRSRHLAQIYYLCDLDNREVCFNYKACEQFKQIKIW